VKATGEKEGGRGGEGGDREMFLMSPTREKGCMPFVAQDEKFAMQEVCETRMPILLSLSLSLSLSLYIYIYIYILLSFSPSLPPSLSLSLSLSLSFSFLLS